MRVCSLQAHKGRLREAMTLLSSLNLWIARDGVLRYAFERLKTWDLEIFKSE